MRYNETSTVEAQVIKPNLSRFGQFPEVEVVNPDEGIWSNHYLIAIDYFKVYYVIADCEQDALDILIDYCEERNYQGYFYTDEDLEEMTQEEQDDLLIAGNHCRYISNDVLIIEQL
jgi:hypothetical protein